MMNRAFDRREFVAAEAIGPRPDDFGHTYRAWLDDTGAPMSVQQQLMRRGCLLREEISTKSRWSDSLGAGPSAGCFIQDVPRLGPTV